MHYMSICATIKNEALYLDEWIQFHIKQGIDHFYLYDNDSDDNTYDIAKSYGSMTTVRKVTGLAIQRSVYDSFITTHRDKTTWSIFIDVDEFLYPVEHGLNFVRTFNTKYDLTGIDGLAVNWLLYGSNGHLEYSPEPVVKRFTRRAEEVNPHVKSIMRMSNVISTYDNVHAYRTTGRVFDENFIVLPHQYCLHYDGTCNVFAINHYVTKSENECRIRREAPRADTGGIREVTFFETHDRNDVEDLRIQAWI